MTCASNPAPRCSRPTSYFLPPPISYLLQFPTPYLLFPTSSYSPRPTSYSPRPTSYFLPPPISYLLLPTSYLPKGSDAHRPLATRRQRLSAGEK